ncbi:TolC family protein [Aestuariibaculum sediminum]|uniref:TolC family protein n=1 Tax=Aestuariibaculum sediminum TaxID=2770637 RepID=A0A8J6Q0U9_9FLAO|nr:TolC family protein [Aestuariibaculum sediminum]MBD0833543.1 TolC family protein [Aestuariibaculum sediminum]
MKQNLILVFGLLLSTALYSQEQSYTFNLQEAIDFAIENNRTSINAAKDIEAAEKQKWETTATGLPQLNATVDYQNFLKQQVSLIPAEAFGGTPGEFEEVIFGTKQNMVAQATITQKIFDGSYIVGLQSAKVYLDISKNAKEKTDLEIRKSVINAYGNVLLAEESLALLNKDRKILEDNIRETTKIYENGLGEEESVEQLQITLSSLNSNLNKTERLKVLAYQMLNITLGLNINTEVTLSDQLESLTVQNINLNLLSTEENIENSVDYKIAENAKVSQELLLKLEKSKALPTLNAFVNGGYSAFSNNFDFASSDQKWFGSSLLGVSLNIPIFSSLGRTAATARVKIELEKAKNDLLETEQQLKLQVARAKSEYQFAIEDYENKKLNLNLAERIERKNQTKFFEGIGSSFDLRQAQTQLYNAQQEFLQTMLDVINTKAELETILNTVQFN